MRKLAIIFSLIIALTAAIPSAAHAREGDNGYQGGISAGFGGGKTVTDYQEVCFITGEPVVFKGTLTIKRSMKKDNEISTYSYTLRNDDRKATLTRVLNYTTKITKKGNGQTIEETALSGRTSEVIKIGEATYTLKNYDFSRTNIIDAKPAVNYHAGNLWGRKTYQVGTGASAASASGIVTVEETGKFNGYENFWGETQIIQIDYIIESESKKRADADRWGGTAQVSISSGTAQEIEYYENIPGQISFNGGYVQTQHNESILKYSSSFPEFDQKGLSTDVMVMREGTLKQEAFPAQKRLPVANLNHLRGHWAEDEIRKLYGLEIWGDTPAKFNPEQYVRRSEFADAVSRAANKVPEAESLKTKVTARASVSRKKAEEPESSFLDVAMENRYSASIEDVYKRGLMNGTGYGNFSPDGYLTTADAVLVFVRALGLENLAPNPAPVTIFKDNDKIPQHTRGAVYVAEKLGLIEADKSGNINANEILTKAKASVLLDRLIRYMRDDMKQEYGEKILDYNM